MKILIVDDEKSQLNILSDILSDAGYECITANRGEAAIRRLAEHPVPIVLTDLKMPGRDGNYVLREALHIDPDIQVILMTAFGSIPSAVSAIKTGAYDYLTKPFSKEELLRTVAHAAEKVELISENRRLKEEFTTRYNYQNIIGASRAMREIYLLIERVKDIDATVLITGESGTGKELVARAIHFSGNRKEASFVAVNCGAIPENLIESELFGHEKGSFTGANRTHIGKFEQAQEGTIFLDEISAMPPNLQVRLLRVLQEKKVNRVGADSTIHLNVRVIAATNENLLRRVEEGTFRNDLFHRLNVFNINLPPLRQRPKDILLLANHFIRKYAIQYDKRKPILTPAALSRLENYPFPGNVRELENIIEKTIILSDRPEIDAGDLTLSENYFTSKAITVSASTLPQTELEMIKSALLSCKGSIKKSSEKLGISYKALQYRMKKLGLDKNQFKN